jgi:hypothetical protein
MELQDQGKLIRVRLKDMPPWAALCMGRSNVHF